MPIGAHPARGCKFCEVNVQVRPVETVLCKLTACGRRACTTHQACSGLVVRMALHRLAPRLPQAPRRAVTVLGRAQNTASLGRAVWLAGAAYEVRQLPSAVAGKAC